MPSLACRPARPRGPGAARGARRGTGRAGGPGRAAGGQVRGDLRWRARRRAGDELAPGNRDPHGLARDRIATAARGRDGPVRRWLHGLRQRGLRAAGDRVPAEPDQLPAGPVALVTQSGSVFSAMLRTRRALGYTVAVSSGQELVTTAGPVRAVRAGPAADPGARPGARGDAGHRCAATGAGGGSRSANSRGAADGGTFRRRARAGDRAFRGAGRRGRGLGGARGRLRRAPGRRPGGADRHA